MPPLTEKERFAPTQPLAEHQLRLRAQRRWVRPAYSPNHVPLGARLSYALLSLTWVGWSLIGLLSGHTFFLISRRGPIHFSGVPAMLFSAAVMASSAACAVAIVDHYDKRDNEEAYVRMRRRLWWTALAFLCLAAAVGLAEHLDTLPYSDGRLGLLPTGGLKSLLAWPWLDKLLAPRKDALERWAVILLFWCMAGLFALSKLGLMESGVPARPGVVFLLVFVVMGPALVTFTLALLATLTSGAFPSPHTLSDDAVRARVAWVQSMLLTCLSLSTFLVLLVCLLVLRAIGILPAETFGGRDAAGRRRDLKDPEPLE